MWEWRLITMYYLPNSAVILTLKSEGKYFFFQYLVHYIGDLFKFKFHILRPRKAIAGIKQVHQQSHVKGTEGIKNDLSESFRESTATSHIGQLRYLLICFAYCKRRPLCVGGMTKTNIDTTNCFRINSGNPKNWVSLRICSNII